MPAPQPRQPVRGSTSGRPIMALLDLLGRRMALRILWELRERRLTFRALQEAAETNPSVLNARLKELRGAHLIAHGDDGYALTPHGRQLIATFLPLHRWAEGWAKLFATKLPPRRPLAVEGAGGKRPTPLRRPAPARSRR
jgi:DNA-binding HxlR family transcriptional regulator